MLTVCSGAVGRDSVLQVIEDLTKINTSTITDPFPYPQIFVLNQLIIVCGQSKIYEWNSNNNTLVEKLTVTAGSTWRVVDFGKYVYMSNGKVSVERSPTTQNYTVSSLPVATGMCNFNGQIVIGAPDVEITDE
jgi:proteasome assembly chaperone (PAC2) family protein